MHAARAAPLITTLAFILAACVRAGFGDGNGGEGPAPGGPFGTGGAVTSNPSDGADGPQAIAMDGTYLYIAGYCTGCGKSGDTAWVIEKRHRLSGELSWSKISDPCSGADLPTDIAVYGTDLYVVGFDSCEATQQWRIEQRSAQGGEVLGSFTLDPTATQDYDIARAVAADASGVYVLGDDLNGQGGDRRWLIQKHPRSIGAALLWSVVVHPTSDQDTANALALFNNRVYAAGAVGGWSFAWHLARLSTASGESDWGHTYQGNRAVPLVLRVASDGAYLGGYQVGSAGRQEWMVLKADPSTGAKVWSHTEVKSEWQDASISALAIDESGIYLGGTVLGDRWLLQKRSHEAGDILWETPPMGNAGDEKIADIAVDSTGLYVALEVAAGAAPNTQWRIEKWDRLQGKRVP